MADLTDGAGFFLTYIYLLFGCGGSLLQHVGSLVVVQGLSCSMACGNLSSIPGQGLCCKADS